MPRSGAGKYDHLGQQPLVWRSRLRPSHLSSPDVCPLYNPLPPPLVLTYSTEHRVKMDCSESGFFGCPSKHDIKPFRCRFTDGVVLCGFLLMGFWGSLNCIVLFPPPPFLVEWCNHKGAPEGDTVGSYSSVTFALRYLCYTL